MGPLPPRLNKKQVIAYLQPDFYDEVISYIIAHRLTRQECVGIALNNVLAGIGSSIVLQTAHKRLVRRGTGSAGERNAEHTPSRRGRIAIGGWFHSHFIDQAQGELADVGLGLQAAVTQGLHNLLRKTAAASPPDRQETIDDIPPPSDEDLNLDF